MIVRNESDRHLIRALASARTILDFSGGYLLATDDASTDNTVGLLQEAEGMIQTTPEPLFWKHEGQARQRHQRWVDLHCSPGDWVLALDGDETVNLPELVPLMAQEAQDAGKLAVGMPLYEFWNEWEYRVDGFWFGTSATRLYAWQHGGQIADASMACGAEPTYVRSSVLTQGAYSQTGLHLLHWGYLDPQDRVTKHQRYTERDGGHGHNNAHVQSIITAPTLRTYP